MQFQRSGDDKKEFEERLLVRSWTKEQRGRRTKCKSQVVSRRSPQVEVSVCSGWRRMHRSLRMLRLWKHRSSSSWPGKNTETKEATVSPYKRKKGSKFMKGQNAEVDCGPWRNIETLCLMLCRNVLQSQELSLNSQTLHAVYDFVAKSPAIMDRSLNWT